MAGHPNALGLGSVSQWTKWHNEIFRLAIFFLCFLSATAGCVQRRLLINSQPEGALVSVDKTQVGHTPVAVPFTYYGTREIQLQKDGYKTVYVKERVRPPWYGVFPISLISENFAFREIRDHRALDFELTPKERVVEGQLMERADQLRTDVQRGTVVAPLK